MSTITTYTSTKLPIIVMGQDLNSTSYPNLAVIGHESNFSTHTSDITGINIGRPAIEFFTYQNSISTISDILDIEVKNDTLRYVVLVNDRSYIAHNYNLNTNDTPYYYSKSFDYTLYYSIDLYDITWTNLVNAYSLFVNHIIKTDTDGWTSGGTSLTTFSGDGGIQFTIQDALTRFTCGVSVVNDDADYDTIDYAIEIYPYSPLSDDYKGWANVKENGVEVHYGSPYWEIGDVFSIVRIDSTIQYQRNGSTFHTSLITSTGDLFVDCSIYTVGGSFGDVQMWENYSITDTAYVTENPVAIVQNDSGVFLLITGSSNSIVYVYNYDGTGIHMEEFNESGNIITDATNMTTDTNNNVWIVTNENPTRLIRMWFNNPIWYYSTITMEF